MVKLHEKIEIIIEEIRQYSREQVDSWKRIPHLALEADGVGGFYGNYNTTYTTGIWKILNMDIGVDCATGELVNPHSAGEFVFRQYRLNHPESYDKMFMPSIHKESDSKNKDVKVRFAYGKDILNLAWKNRHNEELNTDIIIKELEGIANSPELGKYLPYSPEELIKIRNIQREKHDIREIFERKTPFLFDYN